ERPLGAPAPTRTLEPAEVTARPAAAAAATGEVPLRRGARSFYEAEREAALDTPAVPSVAVLRPRRTAPDAPPASERPARRGPNWDDILFGPTPAKDA